jgi:PAS domain S-box-containing protein
MSVETKRTAIKQQTILIVDDDVDLASNLQDILQEEGYQVEVANNGEGALLLCREGTLNLIIADIKLPDISGVELTQQIEAICPSAEVIIVTGYASIDSAIAAVKQRNVIGYHMKPLEIRPMLALVKQVMERQQAQQVARESEQLYRLLAENVIDVIWTADLDLNLTYVSPSVFLLTGYTQEESLKLSLFNIVSPEFLGAFKQRVAQWLSESSGERTKVPTSYVAELENICKDGSRIWTESRVRFMPKTKDKPAYLLGVTRDITRRNKGIEELRLSQARLAEAEKIAHLGHWDWNIITNELIWSDEIFLIFGLTPQQFGATYDAFLKYVHPDDRELVEWAVNESINLKRPYSIDHRVVLPDGTSRFVHEQGEVTFDKQGKPVRMLGVIYDITERKQIEEELRQLSQRLVQVQEEERRSIARELHDQVGQSLTVLKLILDQAKQSCASEKARLEDGVATITDLITTVRNMSLNLRPAMLDDLGLLPTLFWHFDRYTSQTNINVDFKHNGIDRRFPSEITVAAYRIVQEALTNVVRYAGVKEVAVRAWATPDTITLRIEDKGKGFNPETIDARTSSGLLGMQERVRLLDGTLTIESRPGAGTILIASLPVSDEKKRKKQ